MEIALILTSFGTAIACSCHLAETAMQQNLIAVIGFIVVRRLTMSRYKGHIIYRLGIVKLLCVVLIPALMILARLTPQAGALQNEGVTSAYLQIRLPAVGHVMVLAFLIPLAPIAFMTLFSITSGIRIPLPKKRSFTLTVGSVLLMACALLIAGLSAVNDDFGCAVILSGAAILLFFTAGYNLFFKGLVVMGGALGSLGLMLLSDKIRGRLAVFMNMRQAIKEGVGGSESIAYLLQTAHAWGFFGQGPGTEYPILKRQFFMADYIFGCVLIDYGLIVGVLVFVLSLIMVLSLLKSDVEDRKDRICLYAIILIFLISIFFSVGGNLGALPLTGVCYPFLSLSKTITPAFYVNLAVALNIKKRGVLNEA